MLGNIKEGTEAQFMDPPIGPLPSEEDFLFTLKLSEGPPNFSISGIGQWKWMYRLASEAHDPRTMIVAIQNIYSGLNSAGRSGEALVCARRLLSLGYEVGDALVVGHAINNIAWAYWVMGDHLSALHVSREAFAYAATLRGKPLIHPLTGSEEIRASATELIRLVGQSRGYLRRGIADREAALQIYRKRRDLPRIISSLEGLGLVYKDLGDYSVAADYFTEALREADNGAFPNEQSRLLTRAGLLGNLAVVLTYQGETTNALAYIEEAIQVYLVLSDQFGLISALGQKGRALLRSGLVHESIEIFQAMHKHASAFNADSWCYAAHFNLSRAYLAVGERAQAALHSECACMLAKEKLGHIGIDDHWLRAMLFHPLATQDAKGGDLERFVALAYHAVAALHHAVRGSFPGVVIKRWIDAFETLLETICHQVPNKPLSLTQWIETPDGQAAFNAIEDAAQASPFIGWQPSDIGLYCAESLRAQEFQERLLINTAELQELHDPVAVEGLARVEAELEELQHNPPIIVTGTASLDVDGGLLEGERESEESVESQARAQENHIRRREELLEIRDRLARRTIESFDTPVAPLPDPIRLADVREVLGEDELVLEFVLLGQTDDVVRPFSEMAQWPTAGRPQAAYVIAITKSWDDIVHLGPTEEIESRSKKLLDMLCRFGASISLPFFQSEAADAYDLLLRPVWSRGGEALHSVRHLVISPDGLLHKMPFDLLVEDRDDASQWGELSFVVRRFTTEYTPSATFFVDSRRNRYNRGEPGIHFVGLGDPMYTSTWQPSPLDPLPGTRQELDSIYSIFRQTCSPADDNPVSLLLGAEASKACLTNADLLQQAAYLHLCCHGTAGTQPFPDGAIYLAQRQDATVYESVLTSREVMDLRTNAKLVVLSACESGLGTLSRGEGIQGLTRAWLFAGAKAVTATFWRVDDEATAELMANFYRALLVNTGSIADALAEAKRMSLASEHFACPAFWGAFFVTGGRAVVSSIPRTSPNVRRSPDPHSSPTQPKTLIPLSHGERRLLSTCARTWESAWGNERQLGLPLFCNAATSLGQALSNIGQTSALLTASPIGLVARNCRVAWEYCARNHQMDFAIKAYQAYVTWVPSAQTEEMDALASAYLPENLTTVRTLTREGRLKRMFELSVDESLGVALRTTVAWTGGNAVPSENCSSIKVALPADASVSCKGEQIMYCQNSGWVVFQIKPDETVYLTEQLLDCVVTCEDNTFVIGGTWGSRVVPHDLTIRLHPDFIPLRFQREMLGKGVSMAAVRFTTDGAIVTVRTTDRPWLDHIGLLFVRAPGAIDMFAASDSPFLSETEFGEFERLLQQAQMHSQD